MSSYYVLLGDSTSLYQFEDTIHSVFGQESPVLDYVGGQNRSVILYGSLCQLAHPAVGSMIDSAFELPLLARIEIGVISKLAEAINKDGSGNDLDLPMMVHYLTSSSDDTLHLQRTHSDVQVSNVSEFVSSLRDHSFKSEEQRSAFLSPSFVVIASMCSFLYQQESHTQSPSRLSPLSSYLDEHRILFHSFSESSPKAASRSIDVLTNLYFLSGKPSDLLAVLLPVARAAPIRTITLVEEMTFDNNLRDALPKSGLSPRRLNDKLQELIPEGAITGSMANTLLFRHNLHGSGVLIGVADTGLDVYHAFFYDSEQAIRYSTLNPNLNHRKVVLYYDYQDRSEYQVGGHGSHICSIIAGQTNISSISQYNVAVEERNHT